MARKILLADDSVTAQNMGRKILTDAGYEVVAVNNGSAALKKIAEHKPDLIVLDVYMPGYSGLEVCQRIKENRETARIPVLLTVGKLEPFKPEEARRARADAFVVKPFEASELLTALTKLEDKIIPSDSHKPGRFAKAIASLDESAGAESGKFGDADEGWKSRLRIPTKKPKPAEREEEKDKEQVESVTITGKGVHDLVPEEPPRKGRKGQEPAAHKAEPPAPPAAEIPPEHPVPAGLPADITPEEIAAITAAAARLSGLGATENSAAAIPPPSVDDKPVSAAATDISEASPASPLTAIVAEEHEDAVTAVPSAAAAETAPAEVSASREEPSIPETAPVTFASAPDLQTEPRAAEPVGKIEEPAIFLSPSSVDAAEESRRVDELAPSVAAEKTAEKMEPPAAVEPMTAQPAALAEPSAAAVDAEPPTREAVSQEATAEVIRETAQAPVVEAAETPAEVASHPPEGSFSASVPPAAAQIPTSTSASSMPEAPAAIVASAPAADDDVMTALQSLIPVAAEGPATVASEFLGGRLVETKAPAASALADSLLAGAAMTGPRWIAEEVPLSIEESTTSLEKEMETAYAAFAASEAARLLSSSVVDSFPGMHSAPQPAQVADIAAPPSSQQALPEEGSAAQSEIHAMASAAGFGDAASTASPAPYVEESAQAVHEFAAPQPSTYESVTGVADAAPVSHENEPTSGSEAPAAETEPSPAALEAPIELDTPVETVPESILAGGTDEMDRKNSESLGFKMIRQSPPGGPKATKPETVSKETFEPEPVAPQAEPAVMAAAAAAESARPVAAHSSVADPKAIASIVDSVLAELRPKIVEEIAKKLAGDGKRE